MLKKTYKILTEILRDNLDLKGGEKILDAGCGMRGNFLKIHPQAYVGADIDRKIIDFLRRKKDGKYVYADAKKLIFDDKSFDRVVSVSLFHHFSDSDCLLIAGEIGRVLKDEGIVLIADGVYPRSNFNFLGWGIRFFDRGRFVRKENSLKKIFCENFNIEREYYFINKIFAYSVLIMKKK